MEWTLKLSPAIQRRKQLGKDRTGLGIGVAAGYVATLQKYAARADFATILKDAENRLVFRSDGMEVTGGHSGELVAFGTPKRKNPVRTPKSILDFEAVVTTTKQDRDGDILVTKGAVPDPAMPLLWQHFPPEVIGRMVAVVEHTDDRLLAHFAIADVPLGRDAVKLIELGALRISHGFRPEKAEPLEPDESKEDDQFALMGWRVEKFHIMEASLVSIPSNTDAVIEAWAQEKLHHPLVKGWAAELNAARPKSAVGGFDANGGVVVHVDVHNHLPEPKAAVVPGKKDPADGDGPDTPAGGDKPDEPDKPDKPAEEVDNDATTNEDTVMLDDIAKLIEQAAGMAGLPREAVDRLNVLDGMLASVTDAFGECVQALSAAAEQGDAVGTFEAMADVIEDVVGSLHAMNDEIDRVLAIDGVGQEALNVLAEAKEKIASVVDALDQLRQAAATPPDDGSGEALSAEMDSEASEDGTLGGPVRSSAAEHHATKLLALLVLGKRLSAATLFQLKEVVDDCAQKTEIAILASV